MSEVTVEVPIPLLSNTRNALVAAREDAQELLADHEARLGRTTRKNRVAAEIYEQQIAECDQLIDELERLTGQPAHPEPED